MSQQSPIFIKTEAFLIWLLNHTAKFPKHERFRLAKRIDDTVFAFHEFLIHAARSETPENQLQQADTELTKLRAYLRVALECQYSAANQYSYAAGQLTEIGKLLGSWIKKLES